MSPRYCGWTARPVQVMGLVAMLLAAMVPRPLAAADIQVRGAVVGIPRPDPGTTFGLHLARSDLRVAYADESGGSPLRLRRIGLSLDERLGAGARLGLRLGRAAFTQSGRSTTAGLEPSGYYLGLAFAGAWPSTTTVAFDLRAHWRYTRVDDRAETGARTELSWQTLDLRPSLRLLLGQRAALRAGATGIAVDGDERVAGAAATTTSFEAASNFGGFAALDWRFPDGGTVTLRARGGNPQGVWINFEQRY